MKVLTALLIAYAAQNSKALPVVDSLRNLARVATRWRRNDLVIESRQVPAANTGPPALAAKVKRNTECKNCPYNSCLNAAMLRTEMQVPVSCWTQGDTIGDDDTWLRFDFGLRGGDFCYMTHYDLVDFALDFREKIPYCGARSELHFYLPTARTQTIYYTECSLCPYRDCDGLRFYQSGTELEVNCQVSDGWMQIGPLYPNGTRKYYRTNSNCYVSINNVYELPARPSITTLIMATPTVIMQEPLPLCGPVPHMKIADRPRYTTTPKLTPGPTSIRSSVSKPNPTPIIYSQLPPPPKATSTPPKSQTLSPPKAATSLIPANSSRPSPNLGNPLIFSHIPSASTSTPTTPPTPPPRYTLDLGDPLTWGGGPDQEDAGPVSSVQLHQDAASPTPIATPTRTSASQTPYWWLILDDPIPWSDMANPTPQATVSSPEPSIAPAPIPKTTSPTRYWLTLDDAIPWGGLAGLTTRGAVRAEEVNTVEG